MTPAVLREVCKPVHGDAAVKFLALVCETPCQVCERAQVIVHLQVGWMKDAQTTCQILMQH